MEPLTSVPIDAHRICMQTFNYVRQRNSMLTSCLLNQVDAFVFVSIVPFRATTAKKQKYRVHG